MPLQDIDLDRLIARGAILVYRNYDEGTAVYLCRGIFYVIDDRGWRNALLRAMTFNDHLAARYRLLYHHFYAPRHLDCRTRGQILTFPDRPLVLCQDCGQKFECESYHRTYDSHTHSHH